VAWPTAVSHAPCRPLCLRLQPVCARRQSAPAARPLPVRQRKPRPWPDSPMDYDIYYRLPTLMAVARVWVSVTVCTFVLFHKIYQKLMQLGSLNLTKIRSIISPRKLETQLLWSQKVKATTPHESNKHCRSES